MMMRDIVAHLPVGRANAPIVEFAISVAQKFDAKLTGIAFCYQPADVFVALGDGPADYIEAQAAENARLAEEAIAEFNQAVGKGGVLAEARAVDASVAGAPRSFGELARTFDLSIVSQIQSGSIKPDKIMAEAALFETGRPVIVVPHIQKDRLKLDHVMVCWDGSRAAARALGDAISLLEFAKSIEVVTIVSGHSDQKDLADVGRHLERHGLNAGFKRIVVADVDVASTILSHAFDSSADFIVMGGYGHSRLREFILGGVTREILNTMTVPVFMSH